MLNPFSQVKASMLRECLESLQGDLPPSCSSSSGGIASHHLEGLLPKSKTRTHIPLLERLTCPSLEEKIAKKEERGDRTGRRKRQRLMEEEGEEDALVKS